MAVSQDSTVEYTWTKNGIPVTTSDRLQHSVSRDKLYVVNADQSDSAQYVCIAKNNAGEAKAPFDAIVNGRGTLVLANESTLMNRLGVFRMGENSRINTS